MRAASAASCGFPRISSSTSTMVSAPKHDRVRWHGLPLGHRFCLLACQAGDEADGIFAWLADLGNVGGEHIEGEAGLRQQLATARRGRGQKPVWLRSRGIAYPHAHLHAVLAADAPRHARRVVRQAIAAIGAQQDDAAVPAQAPKRYAIAACAAASGASPARTRSTAHLPSTSFMIGSPQPVSETAALRLSRIAAAADQRRVAHPPRRLVTACHPVEVPAARLPPASSATAPTVSCDDAS